MLKGLKTYLWNWLMALSSILLILSQVVAMPEVQALIPPERLPFIMLVMALINLWLRKVTDGPPRRIMGTGNRYN